MASYHIYVVAVVTRGKVSVVCMNNVYGLRYVLVPCVNKPITGALAL